MSSLERDVKECIEAMFSGKVVEKKVCINNMKLLL